MKGVVFTYQLHIKRYIYIYKKEKGRVDKGYTSCQAANQARCRQGFELEIEAQIETKGGELVPAFAR